MNVKNVKKRESFEDYRVAEELWLRERLSQLSSRDLVQFFRDFRKLFAELKEKERKCEVEHLVYLQQLQKAHKSAEELKLGLAKAKEEFVREVDKFNETKRATFNAIKERAPELSAKLEALTEKQHKLERLRFAQYFQDLRDEVRRCLRLGDFNSMLKNYRELIRLLDSFTEFSDQALKGEFSEKLDTLQEFLKKELENTLFGPVTSIFCRIKFPFEDAVDPKALTAELLKSTEILKCLYFVHLHLFEEEQLKKDKIREISPSKVTEKVLQRKALDAVLQQLLNEFVERFNYHFYGDRKTNLKGKPEWFFTLLSSWIANNLEYMEEWVQKHFVNELGFGTDVSMRELFLEGMMTLAADKLRSLLSDEAFLQDRRLFSHLIDETVLFEKELSELYAYDIFEGSDEAASFLLAATHQTTTSRKRHAIAEFCRRDAVLEQWIRLERDTMSAGVDAILAEKDAYEPRYAGAADVDKFLVPNFADGFVILMQSMSERYRALPEISIQCRFLKLQLVIIDEFRARIVQIAAQCPSPWEQPFFALLNALWFLTAVLEDWSCMAEFVRLQFFLESSGAGGSERDVDNVLTRGTFDDSAGLYKHVWRQRVRELCESFGTTFRRKLGPYVRQEWHSWPVAQPTEITPSLVPLLRRCSELLEAMNRQISPDSVRTLHHLLNHEVWTALDTELVQCTHFNQRGAAQVLFDLTSGLVPLLNACFRLPGSGGGGEGCEVRALLSDRCISVLNTLRLLALSTPVVLLLRDEIRTRGFTEYQLRELLEPHGIVFDRVAEEGGVEGPWTLTKARVLEIFEQRGDLVDI